MVYLLIDILDVGDPGFLQLCSLTEESDLHTISIVFVPDSDFKNKNSNPNYKALCKLKNRVDLIIPVCSFPTDAPPELLNQSTVEYMHLMTLLILRTTFQMAECFSFVCISLYEILIATKKSGFGFISTGYAVGDNKIAKALNLAVYSDLKTTERIKSAKIILLMINSGEDVRMKEIEDIMNSFDLVVNDECDIIWNLVMENTLKNEIRIALIVPGFDTPPVFD